MPSVQVCPSREETCFPDSVARASARVDVPIATARVVDCVRNLGCLAHWWPGARGIVAVPPGVYGAGDVAVLSVRGGSVRVLVIAYKPGRRIVLSLRDERRRALVDLRIRACDSATTLELSIEEPPAGSRFAQVLQQLRLRALCRGAAQRLERHLRDAPP